MITAEKRENSNLSERTCYMEVVGNNRVTYRVTTGHAVRNGRRCIMYGVEAEKGIGPVKFKESIDNFSSDLKTAAEFAEMLLKYNIKPSLIYNAALCFLRENINSK